MRVFLPDGLVLSLSHHINEFLVVSMIIDSLLLDKPVSDLVRVRVLVECDPDGLLLRVQGDVYEHQGFHRRLRVSCR